MTTQTTISITNTYLGFTDNKKAMQAARIEKSLDMLWRLESGIFTRKQIVLDMLLEGRKPTFEENYTYYSRRLDDYTKPKTLYKLEDMDNETYLEINKTLYNFAIYILENDFLNTEKLIAFIEHEQQEKENKIKLQLEKEQKERNEKEQLRQQEEKERKERWRIKQAAFIEQGKAFLNMFEVDPINEVLEKHWEQLSKLYKDNDQELNKEEAFKELHLRYTEMLGNHGYCEHTLNYLIENENKEYKNKITVENPIRFFEKEILYHVFNTITLQDSKRTINAKIKAIFENRTYSGVINGTRLSDIKHDEIEVYTPIRIEFTDQTITDNEIRIAASGTEFCNFTRKNYPDIDQLEKEVKQLRKELKSKGVTLSKSNTLKTLKDQKEAYKQAVLDYNNTFNELCINWKSKLETGLYYGYSDDEDYNNVLKPLNFKLQEMSYSDHILTIVMSIKNRVNEIKNDLEHGTEFIKISV